MVFYGLSKFTIVLAVAVLPSVLCRAQTDSPGAMPAITVTENIRPGSLTSPSEADAALQNTQVPGGFTIKDTNDMSRGRGANFEDLLRGVPGVTLQSDNQMEVTRISIRGSGILSEDEPLGLQVLLDGFTFNQGDGEVILEDFDFGGIQYAEVFHGANAFRYGALTLGGAVNLVSKTGYDAAPLQFKLEGGELWIYPRPSQLRRRRWAVGLSCVGDLPGAGRFPRT